MGALYYAGNGYPFDDRVLSHLRVVITKRFSRDENLLLSWTKTTEEGGGRGSLWLSPGSALAFHFDGSREPSLNPVWIEAMLALSHTSRGLIVINEKDAEACLRALHHTDAQSPPE